MRFHSLRGTFGRSLAPFLVAAMVPPASAQQPVVCAFLDPDGAARAGLLEAKLLSDPSVTWVERGAIDKVLKEQTLQAIFGPQGGGERARLGRLLKADVLVLVRPVKEAKEPAVEVVTSDTARGLRLMIRTVAITKDADADVSNLRDAVRVGLKKFHEKIREIVAVPPFASTNLGYEHEHLKGAYAKLVEMAALTNPGVVVVELAEAEAIAREIKLSDPGATVKRAAPLYLLGEFRHQGRGAETQIALKLHAARNGQPVDEPAVQTIAPQSASIVLHKWVADRLAAEKTGSPTTVDSKAEAKQLAELCLSRQRVGDWDNALAFLEASLLLDPNQPELNADAMVLLRLKSDRVLERGTREPDRLRQAAQLHRRGMEHMEALVRSGAKLPRFGDGPESVRGGRMFGSAFPFPFRIPYTPLPPPDDPPEVVQLISELGREIRATALRLLPFIVKDGTEIEVAAFTSSAVHDLPLTEQYAGKARLIVQFQDFAAMRAAALRLTTLWSRKLELDELPIYRKFLDRLDKEGNAEVRATVTQARKNLPALEKEMIAYAAQAAEQKRFIEEVTKKNRDEKLTMPARLTKEQQFSAIDERLKGGPLNRIRLKGAVPEDEWFVGRVSELVAAGSGIDVYYAWGLSIPAKFKGTAVELKPGLSAGQSGPVLLIMKQKGELRRAWAWPGAPSRLTAACFDGRFVWLATEDFRQPPALLVFDPIAEKGYQVTPNDGLPQPPEKMPRDLGGVESLSLVLAPLGPGRVCVAGSFGRAWVAIATFDSGTRKSTVKVIHEARELPRQDEKEKELWMNRNLTFSPIYARSLRGSPDATGKGPTRVIIGRRPHLGINNNTAFFGSHPLVINPDEPSVEVMKDSIFPFSARDSFVVSDGALLVAQVSPPVGKVRLLRVEYPGTVRDLGPLGITRSIGLQVGISKDLLHFAVQTPGPVGKEPGSIYWTADLDGKNLRMVTDQLIHIRKFAHSEHYGLVAWSGGSVLCQVHDDQSKK